VFVGVRDEVIDVCGYVFGRRRTRQDVPIDVATGSDEHLNNLQISLSLFASSFQEEHLSPPFLARDVSAEIGHTQMDVVSVSETFEPWEGDLLEVDDHPMTMTDLVLITDMKGLDVVFELIDVGDATTRDVEGVSWGLSAVRPTEELVEVGVVDTPRYDVPRLPRETRVARHAPHLITPRHLEDARVALRTWLCILTEDLDRLLVVVLTLVIAVSFKSLIPMTVGTDPVLAQATLVGAGHPPATLRPRTRHEKLLTLLDRSVTRVLQPPVLSVLGLVERLEGRDLFLYILHVFLDLIKRVLLLENLIELIETGLRLGGQRRLLFFPIFFVQERHREMGTDELHVPSYRTVHTLWLDRVLKQVVPDTRRARLVLARGTLDLAPVLSVDRHADRTLHRRCC